MARSWRTSVSTGEFDVAVVGSGIGGCAAAALLAKHGLRPVVFEKNHTPGGILASYRRNGFKLDVGSHLIPRGEKGPIGVLLNSLGIKKPRFIRHKIPSTSRGIFYCKLPEKRWGLLGFAIKAAHDLRIPAFETMRIAKMLYDILYMPEEQLVEWDNRTLDEFIRNYTEHPGAYFLFSFLMSIFFVLPPWHASAGESIYTLRRFIKDYHLSYVEGGMDSLAEALLNYAEAKGGEVVVNAQVLRVERLSNGKFRVFASNGNEVIVRAVVFNMFPADALKLLETERTPELEQYEAQAKAIKPSMNAYQVKLGLKRKLVEEGCFIGGVSLTGLTLADLSLEMFHEATERITAGQITDPLSVYAPVPTNFDPTLAPEGKQLIVASVYGPIRTDPVDPPERWREHILKVFASIIPNLYDELEFYEFTNIPEVGAWMGKTNNAAISNGQYPGQVGASRLSVKVPVPGVYICGDGAGGRGIGTELATSSAFEAVAALVEELSRA